ncbi:hypothetical protein GE061_001602 [Apolygus lucorum]|uniref:FP protein C-terminal domain-containing protein n=1 Tax=Apolygus lucorum TaxID=248454 RepID=A0A6A4KFN4_APOLU|nr:hypothetical protein GE061_001602 [Apolygus lucorum]
MNKEARQSWKCDKCKGVISDDTSVPPGVKTSGPSNSGDSSDEESMDEGAVGPLPSDLSTLMKMVSSINSKVGGIPAIERDLAELRASVEYMSVKFDTFVADMIEMKKTVKFLETENTELKKTVDELQSIVDVLDQRDRSSKITIDGIPETADEDCKSIAVLTAKALNLDITPVSAFRGRRGQNQATDKPRKIIVDVGSEEASISFVSAAKKKKRLRASDLNQQWPDSVVFVNEYLTYFKSNLLRKAKERARSKNMKYVWMKGYVIHVRRDENARPIVVKSLADLEKI